MKQAQILDTRPTQVLSLTPKPIQNGLWLFWARADPAHELGLNVAISTNKIHSIHMHSIEEGTQFLIKPIKSIKTIQGPSSRPHSMNLI